MIKNTFLFLPKIKQKKEISLWRQGIKGWDDFLAHDVKGISKRLKAAYDSEIRKAKASLYENDPSYFLGKLPVTEAWRLYDYFRDEAVFLDIETSSSTSKDSFLTVVGLYDGTDTKSMVKNVNFNAYGLGKELKKYKLLITFNGSVFDVPYLRKKYPGLIPEIPHIDLRHCCARVGLRHGLKEIERELGISRENIIVQRMYGGDPYKLWRMFRGSGDDYYLKLLVEYNEEDVINLKQIADQVIPALRSKTLSF